MTRGKKIAAIIAGSVVGIVVLLFVAGIILVQTQWFRNTVRDKIVSAVADSTGGRVDIGSFNFDWTHLRAIVRDFVIHGTEPASAPPLFQARLVEVDLKFTSPFKNFVDIAYLLVDTPQADVIVYPDGSTNIPSPKIQHKSNKSGLETVVDLAIGRFDLRNGSFLFSERKMPLDAHGENLRAELSYNPASPSYQGQVSIQPLLVNSGGNQPVDINVKVPVVLGKDKIEVTNAQVTTPESQIVLTGTMDHLVAPRTSARVNGHVALDEVQRIAGGKLNIESGRDLPRDVSLDAAFSAQNGNVNISRANITLGQSRIEAAGTPNQVRFSAQLATGQLERLFRLSARPMGTVDVSGNARLNLPDHVVISDLRLTALGGGLTGDAALDNTAFRFNGSLHGFDIQTVARALSPERLPYDGVISGQVEAHGDTKTPSALTARADLAIAPGSRGVPVSGRIRADYEGRADTVTLARSYIALPNTRLDVSGSLGRRIDVRLVSHNLADFQPLLSKPLPVAIERGGSATFTGEVSGSLSAPHIAGHLAVSHFAAEGRPFQLLAADLAASPAGAAVSNGTLGRAQWQAQFAARVGLRNWKPEPREPLAASLSMRNADVQDLLALAGQNEPVTGSLTASAQISGTIGNPRGNVDVAVVNGSAWQEHFDQLLMHANLTNQLIDVPTLQLTAGTARIDANASYQHDPDSLDHGLLRAHLASNQIQLAQFRNISQKTSSLGGQARILADATATVGPVQGKTAVDLTSLNANVAAHGVTYEGKPLGGLTATAQTAGKNLAYQVNSDFAGSTIRVSGQSLLADDHPTTATASIAGLSIQKALDVAGRTDIPASGTLSANANLSGTIANPQVKAGFAITGGRLDQQPFDRLQAEVSYTSQLIQVASFEAVAGPNRVDFSGLFAHPAGDYQDGQVRFDLKTNRIQLARLPEAQRYKPGIGGALEISANGAGTLRRGAAPLVSVLNANLAATGMTVNGKPAGDVSAIAETRGNELQFHLKSDFAQANIQGNGTMQLAGDYPLNARVTFAHITWSGLQPWLNTTARPGFEALAEGEATVSGPVSKVNDLKGDVRLARLEVNSSAIPGAGGAGTPRRSASVKNAGPIEISLDRSLVEVRSFHLTGTDTDLTLSGTASLAAPQTLALRANGNVHLEILQAFDPNIFSAGTITLAATVQGTLAQPAVNGRLQLQNASVNLMNAPNGLSDANGLIVFNGNRAVIQSFTGKTGGGQVTLSGYAAYGGPAAMQLRVQATAHHVRVDAVSGVSIEVNANLTLAGTTDRNLLSGTVTVLDVAMYSHTDIASILTPSTPPPVSQPETGLLGGMQFDVRIRAANNLQVRTTLAQNIQASANLSLRGSPSSPGMLGRVDVTQGELVFFGSHYTLDQGTIAFYDPHKINPYLNVDLETTVQAITVVLTVNGPMDRLKLTYRSDPPMQFSDLVSLLASGKVPTSDPVLAARQPTPPQQNMEQMGASAVLGAAVANPVAGRLQRLFGVTRLKISPEILGETNTPAARMTLEQQITKQILFTYTQDVSSSNPQIIRVEWDMSHTWTAVVQRDQYGELAVDLFYKKRFH